MLITCFNRRDLTIAALQRLATQDLFREEDLYLVDDGCTDGTGDAVRALMPRANVIVGDGSLFWNGGMRLAWDRAKAAPVAYDHYLWLNDDVVLEQGVIADLVADADSVVPGGGPVIVAAAAADPADRDTIVYSAQSRPDPARRLRLSLLRPTGAPVRADTVSGNIVLVSAAAEARLGNLRADFEHIYGDLDYGLRAAAAGVPVYLASKLGGTCAPNSPAGNSLDRSLPKWRRLKLRWQEAGKVNARDWRRFAALHGEGRVALLKHRLVPYYRILTDRPHRHSGSIVATPAQAGDHRPTSRAARLLGPAYPLAMRVKGSRPLRVVGGLPGAAAYWRARAAGRPIGIDIATPVGMGAILAHAILLEDYFARSGIDGAVRASSPLYGDGGVDVLAQWFEREPWPAGVRPLSAAGREFVIHVLRPRHIPLARAEAIFASRFRPNARLRAEIARAAGGRDSFDLAIHYRGTDKIIEAGQTVHGAVLSVVAEQLAGHAAPQVFLATDDPGFARAARAALPNARFTSYDRGAVPDGMARHFSPLAPEDKALEALVNMFLIARAPVCVRTSSFLSSMARLANPAQRTITVNRTLAKQPPFPEGEILREERKSEHRT